MTGETYNTFLIPCCVVTAWYGKWGWVGV